jgi:activator of 2-hydroxyglutaryl-CoA dehydratase
LGCALGGHKEIVEWVIELGATGYNKAMIRAARGGYKKIAERILELGAENYNTEIDFVTDGGRDKEDGEDCYEVVELIGNYSKK